MILRGAAAALAISATVAPAAARAQPLVLFFGGRGATPLDMLRWKAAARDDARYGARFAFQAIAHPAWNGDERGAAARTALAVQRLAFGLMANPDREIFLVGHSSGATLAASVLSKLRDGRHVRLILLDAGFDDRPEAVLGFRPTRQLECWSASNGRLGSVNRQYVMASCENHFDLDATRCRTALCLHFWLVNKNAPPALDPFTAGRANSDGSSEGYKGLRINLDWLRNAR